MKKHKDFFTKLDTTNPYNSSLIDKAGLKEYIATRKFKLVKRIKFQSDSTFNVGIYKSKSRKSVVIKSLTSKSNSATIKLLFNEACLYKILDKRYPRTTVFIPKLLSWFHNNNLAILVREYLPGTPIRNSSPEEKISYYQTTLSNLKSISENLTKKELQILPKRKPWHMFTSLPVLLLIAIYKNPSSAYLLIRCGLLFYYNHLTMSIFNPRYTVAHRDLTSDNIIKDRNKLGLIDIETMMLCEEETDIALFPRFYFREIPLDKIYSFLQDKLYTNSKIMRFYRLSIFYAIHFLTIEKTNSEYYAEALNFLKLVNTKIRFKVKTQKYSLSDVVLRILLYFTKIVSLFRKNLDINPHILCFHGIGDDTWQFTQTQTEFEDLILHLRKSGIHIDSLPNLIESKKKNTNRIAITFDDGYVDLLSNVLPITKRYQIEPTVFVIGKPEDANRHELQNLKSILTTDQLRKLLDAGWKIGYHTATHADLSKMNPNQAMSEILGNRIILEGKLNTKFDYFAYPRGFYNKEILKIVSMNDFKYAFTVDGGRCDTFRNKLSIPRVSLSRGMSPEQIILLLSPIGSELYRIYMSTLKLKQALLDKFN